MPIRRVGRGVKYEVEHDYSRSDGPNTGGGCRWSGYHNIVGIIAVAAALI
jgi:hypothetical protein